MARSARACWSISCASRIRPRCASRPASSKRWRPSRPRWRPTPRRSRRPWPRARSRPSASPRPSWVCWARPARPYHYTEQVAAHAAQHRDHGPRAFLDTFSSRSLTLFYQAWRKYRLELRFQLDGRDSFLPLLLSLAGLGNEALRRRLAGTDGGGVLDESIGHFAAAVRQRPMSAAQMARVLADYFGVAVRAEQFVGGWYPVPPGQETLLGRSNSVLGGGALAGERVWQRHLRLGLVIGPLERAAFARFLPGRAGARALASMLAMFAGVALELEVRLMLRAADVDGATLGGTRQLGWDCFLVTGPGGADRGDVRYTLNPV